MNLHSTINKSQSVCVVGVKSDELPCFKSNAAVEHSQCFVIYTEGTFFWDSSGLGPEYSE